MPPGLRLDRGGFLGRLEDLAHLDRLRRRIGAAVLVTWVPLVALGALDQAVLGRVSPLLSNLSVHVRFLVVVPLLLTAEWVLGRQALVALARLVDEGIVAGAASRFDHLVRRARHLRDARAPEIVLVLLSLLAGVASLVGWTKPAGMISGAATAGLTFTRLFYALVALPLSTFVFWRVLWRSAIWLRVLAGLSRLPLTLEPGHPDTRGGLGFLKKPSLTFSALFLLALGCMISAGWGVTLLGGAAFARFRILYFGFLVISVVFTFGPLLLFTPQLYLTARRGHREFGALATEYIRRFRRRWVTPGAHEDLLGNADLQSLNDIGNAFHESVERASVLLFTGRDVTSLVLVLLIPTVPLLLAEVPFDVVIRKVAQIVLGIH